MSLRLINLLKVLLMCVFIQTIVGASSEMFTNRRERTASQIATESGDLQKDDSQHEPHERQARSQAQNHTNLGDIFILGPEKGVVLFNTHTGTSAPTTDIHDSMQADQSQIFKNQTVRHRRPHTPTRNTPIVYPDQYEDAKLMGEPDCEESIHSGRPYCTKIRNYQAYQQLQSTLKDEIAKFKVFFGEDLELPSNVTQRMNTGPDEEDLCASNKKVIHPQVGQTRENTWLYIVNDQYKQGVLVEECSQEGAACNVIKDSLPNHYTATCKQSYIYRTLVAIGEDNKTVTKEQFRMPSCCKCVLKHTRN